MKRTLAFVLAGGGAKGALQVGALRALCEVGIQPDLLVGSSVGAINAAFLGLHGYTSAALDQLEAAWLDASKVDLLPQNPAWLTMRVFFNRIHVRPDHRMRDFFISNGVTPDLRFADLPGPHPILVSADLNKFGPIFYGSDPQQSVLDGLLASTALPPWVHPIETRDHFLADGGMISNLPIEPAILHGATEVIALDLPGRKEIDLDVHGFGPFWTKLLTTVTDRQIYLEMELARAKKIPVHLVELTAEPPVPIWDFHQTQTLIEAGYRKMKAALAADRSLISPKSLPWYERWMGWNLFHRHAVQVKGKEVLRTGKVINR